MATPDGPEQREADLQERSARDFAELLGSDDGCDFCNGSGLVTIQYGGDGYGDKCCARADADDQPCGECNPDYSRVRP